jgi:hypothetical protein
MMAYRRAHPRSAPFLALTSFSDYPQLWTARFSRERACASPGTCMPRSAAARFFSPGRIELPPGCFLWLTGA